jgi:branched-chain amino acid transport system substrate-binding protein
MEKFGRVVFSALLCAMLATAAGPAGSQSPYTIDVVMSLTGFYAFVGNQDADVLRVFEENVNRKGGLRGQPIHFDIHDDQSSVQQAVSLSTQLIAKHPAVIIGSQGGSLCGAMAPLFKDNGPVMYCLVPSIYPPKDGFVFAAQIALNPFVNGMIRYLRLRGWTRLGIITSTDGSGLVDDVATKESLTLPENKDVQVVAWEHFNPTDINVNAQAIRIRNANPQAIIVWTAGTSFGTVLRSFNDTGIDVPLETTNANLQAPQLNEYQAFYPKELVMPGPGYLVPNNVQTPAMRRSYAEMLAAFDAAHKKPQPGSAPSAWDTASIVFSGLQKLGPGATANDLRLHILGLRDFAGVNGTYDFSRGDQHGLSDQSVVMTTYDIKKQEFYAVSGPGGVPLPRRR